MLTGDALVGEVAEAVPGHAEVSHQLHLLGTFQQLEHGGPQAQVDDEDGDVGEETAQGVPGESGEVPHDAGSGVDACTRLSLTDPASCGRFAQMR